MRRVAGFLLALTLGGCTSYADPETIRAPQSPTEQLAFNAALARVTPVQRRLALANQDVCQRAPCRLDLYLGIANGIGGFADSTHVWLPVPMVQETKNDDELALVIAHEWAHVLVDRGASGFDAGRELRADCLGAMIAQRAGFNPHRGADLHHRLMVREAGERLLLIGFGIVGGGTTLPWSDRIAMIERAGATDASKDSMARLCGVRF